MASHAQNAVGDFTAAAVACSAVAPFVTAVDKAIAQSAGGQITVWSSLGNSCREFLASPLTFVRAPAMRYIAVMYGGTYWAANTFASVEEYRNEQTPVTKTCSIFCVNASLALWKDSAFAKLFGTGPPKPVPIPAYFSWWGRDFLMMAFIFTLPPYVSAQLQQAGVSERAAQMSTQFGLALAVQPIVAPFHLYGYVKYNSPQAPSDQIKQTMRKEIRGAVEMRILRCIPPYCFGTILNKAIRNSLKA
eukprot:gnl/TRDRNA2_/TRDRNA2_187016_c0_seq1.p1 gnl/TRDRNA2_/TRDRNA2_187016_c0~~gnl/TRDRNA2_/TRDRNA2_187016_c0_seq1.p1  ORF type:complete len:260 (-),score=28.45 gnl/TRDRNA2_/TRDRNA2_187016_c0_seq1:136-876(-)